MCPPLVCAARMRHGSHLADTAPILHHAWVTPMDTHCKFLMYARVSLSCTFFAQISDVDYLFTPVPDLPARMTGTSLPVQSHLPNNKTLSQMAANAHIICTCASLICMHAYACVHMHACICMHAYAYACIHMHAYICMHAYPHL